MNTIKRAPLSSSAHKLQEIEQKTSPEISWTRSIRSAVELGGFRRALLLYGRMHSSGHAADPFIISAALKSVARLHVNKLIGDSLHVHAIKLGHRAHLYTHAALVHFYSKLYGVDIARKVFDEIPARNVVAWNSVLSSYAKAGELEAARELFDEMPVRDVVSWNTMVSGYAKEGRLDCAAAMFERMQVKNAASWNAMISGYIEEGDMVSAREMFDRMPEKSNVSWVSMISGYSRHGDVESACNLFDQMQERDIFSWNAIIACCTQNGWPRQAIRFFNKMHKLDAGVRPDEMTYTSIISASSQLGDLRFGSWVEKHMLELGISLDDHLCTALIDLYAKCGGMNRAVELFDGFRTRDVVSYSAMIFGSGINGDSERVISLYKEMLNAKIQPNAVTFIGLLTAYNHAGLVEEARRCCRSMNDYGVAPTADHYAIMVDLLGRNGRLGEAYGLIKEMAVKPHVGVWGALLLSCRLHGNVDLGEIAAKHCFELEPESSGYYVLLANIYADAGEWSKARELRKLMLARGLNKTPGRSWFEPG